MICAVRAQSAAGLRPSAVTMNSLAPEELGRIQIAQECLRHGDAVKAAEQLKELRLESINDPSVLEIRWEICAQDQQWEAALEIGHALRETSPENRFGWLYEASSLIELNRAAVAFDLLVKAAERFPDDPVIPYNLTCCACRLKRVPEASKWLAKAIELGGRAEIKLMALDDKDLAPMLDEICAL